MNEPTGLQEPSWTGFSSTALSLADSAVLLIRARRAAQMMRTGTGLTMTEADSATKHPCRLYALCQHDQRVARRAVAVYRRPAGEIIQQYSSVLGVLCSSACFRLHQAMERVGRLKGGSLPKRVRGSQGCTMLRLLSSRLAYTDLKRSGVDKDGVITHRVWKLDVAGHGKAWTYKPVSVKSCERLHTMDDCRVIRLGANGAKRSDVCFSVNNADDAHLGRAHFADQDTDLAADLKISTYSCFSRWTGLSVLR